MKRRDEKRASYKAAGKQRRKVFGIQLGNNGKVNANF
jgi:hypothetical protein